MGVTPESITEDPPLIGTVDLRSPRTVIPGRLLRGVRSDVAAYRDGLRADLRALAADSVAWYLAVVVLLSQLVDALSTVMALASNLPEGNPLSAAVIARWGVPGLFAEKVVIVSVVVWNMARLRGRSAWALGSFAAVIGFAAAAWNLHLML